MASSILLVRGGGCRAKYDLGTERKDAWELVLGNLAEEGKRRSRKRRRQKSTGRKANMEKGEWRADAQIARRKDLRRGEKESGDMCNPEG